MSAPLQPFSEDTVGALCVAIDFLMRTVEANRSTIGGATGLDRGDVGKFLNRKALKDSRERLIYEKFGGWAFSTARDRRPLPGYMRQVFEGFLLDGAVDQVFTSPPGGGGATSKLGKGGALVVEDAVSLTRSSGYLSNDNATIAGASGPSNLEGLSILVRPSNEPLRDGGVLSDAVSLSLLNVIPPHVQFGRHHPLFKLSQKGVAGTLVDIEGILLCQSGRFVLSGRDTVERRNMIASIYVEPDSVRGFRSAGAARKGGLSGVMLGLSNQRVHFGSLFKLFWIPGSFLSESDIKMKSKREAFSKLYDKLRYDTIGVYLERDVEAALASIGVEGASSTIATMLERSADDRVFRIA